VQKVARAGPSLPPAKLAEVAMLKGIHRRTGSLQDQEPNRAWVSENAGDVGEWVTEDEYRARGYEPEFEKLPVVIVRRVPTTGSEEPPEVDRLYLENYIREKDSRS
jgi:hypothetical protein